MKAEGQAATPASRKLRLLGGVAVLALLVAAGAILTPAYVANWELQRFVTQLSHNSPATASQESIRAQIVNRAASLGLPVRSDDVSVETSGGSVKIQVLYAVHVDIAGYAVDLHFRPSAGG